MPVPQPTIIPEWAMDDQQDQESGQYNVVEPPTERKLLGWYLGEKPNRQWWNWFQRGCALWIRYLKNQPYAVTSNSAGVALFPMDLALITIDAIDLSDTTKYLRAVGFKPAGSAPVFAAGSIQANGLALGTGTVGGNQPITGGANVLIRGTSSLLA